MSYVKLPVTREVFEFLAEQIRMRGQPERVRGSLINMEGVNIALDPHHVLTSPLYGVDYADRADTKQD